MASTGCEKVLRDLHFDLDQLPDSFAQRVAVPSVGIDFGSYHIRVALIDNTPENKVSVCLATFSSADFETALQQAKKHLSKEDGVSVFYTGRATDSHVEAIKTSFPTAKEVSRRDKLDSHNAGAGFLIKSSLPNETLFHDLSEIEKKVASVPQNPEVMAAMFPPKMVQMMGMFFQEVAMSASKTFPFVLSIVGANNIICQVEENGSYKTADTCSTGGNSLNTIWNLIGHPGHTENFEHLMQLAKEGERRKIDGVTTEILDFVGFYAMMPRDFPVFTFGKMEKLKRDEVEPKDLARALAAYTSDILLGRVTDITKVLRTFKTYYAGSLFQHEAIRNEMAERSFAWGGMGMIKPQFFKTDATAALGACIDTSAN